LWFLQQLEPGNSVYNNVLLIRFEGALDIAVLERSLNQLIQRHEALRTCFTVVDGVPVQFALPELALALAIVDVPPAEDGDRFAAALRRATEAAGRPFDLAGDRPPVRVLLLRAGAEDHLLLVAIHHIVCDGESITTLMRELVTLYSACAEGQPNPLEALPSQYIDAVNQRHRQLSGERMASGLDYWRRQLADAPPLLELPLDRSRPAVESFRGGLYRIVLPRELTEAVRAFSRQQGVTLYMTVLAALQVLMHRYSGQRDVLVGTPITGRTRGALRGMVGYLVNTIVLRAKLQRGLTVRELLRDVRGTAMAAFRHSYVPFERVLQALRPPRSRSHHPVFQVFLSFHERGGGWLHESSFEIPGLRVSFPQVDIGGSRFDLSLCVHEAADSLGIDFEYSSDLFDHPADGPALPGSAGRHGACPRHPGRRAAAARRGRARPAAQRLEPRTHDRARCAVPAPADRGAGGAHAAGRGGDLGAGADDLRGAGPPRQPARPSPAPSGRGPGAAGGHLRGAVAGDGGRPARHPEIGRGLRLHRAEHAAGAPRVHPAGLGRAADRGPGADHGGAALHR
jgi:hypothetical protein